MGATGTSLLPDKALIYHQVVIVAAVRVPVYAATTIRGRAVCALPPAFG